MENLTSIIEAIIFASGNAVPLSLVAEKLNVTKKEIDQAIEELKEKYNDEGGQILLLFNGKAQFSTNPLFKDSVSAVLNQIKEKELTKAILECAAIIAYKQPITRTELEAIRGVSSDYAIRTLLELQMIEPVGRKDAIGKPVLYGTTDTFLKRFKLNSLSDLPDYDVLMESLRLSDDDESYLYAKDEYTPEESEEVPDFLKDIPSDKMVKIDE